jgi:hypothetical protein
MEPEVDARGRKALAGTGITNSLEEIRKQFCSYLSDLMSG